MRKKSTEAVIRAVVVPALGLSLATILSVGCERRAESTGGQQSTGENSGQNQTSVPGMVPRPPGVASPEIHTQLMDTGVMPGVDAGLSPETVRVTTVGTTTMTPGVVAIPNPGMPPVPPGVFAPGVVANPRPPGVTTAPGSTPVPGVRVAPGVRPRPGGSRHPDTQAIPVAGQVPVRRPPGSVRAPGSTVPNGVGSGELPLPGPASWKQTVDESPVPVAAPEQRPLRRGAQSAKKFPVPGIAGASRQ